MSLCPLLWSCSRTWMWMCTSIGETVKYCDIIISNIFITNILINNILIIIIALFLYSLLALIANNRLVCSGRVKSLPIDGVVWYVALRRKWTQSEMEQIMFTWRNEENIAVEYDKSNLNIDYLDENDCQVKDSGRIKTWTGTQVFWWKYLQS